MQLCLRRFAQNSSLYYKLVIHLWLEVLSIDGATYLFHLPARVLMVRRRSVWRIRGVEYEFPLLSFQVCHGQFRNLESCYMALQNTFLYYLLMLGLKALTAFDNDHLCWFQSVLTAHNVLRLTGTHQKYRTRPQYSVWPSSWSTTKIFSRFSDLEVIKSK